MEQDDDVRQHLQSVSSIVNFQTLYIVKKDVFTLGELLFHGHQWVSPS